MKAIVRGVSASFENALASYFGYGPTSLDEAKSQHLAYVSKLKELGLSVKEIAGILFSLHKLIISLILNELARSE